MMNLALTARTFALSVVSAGVIGGAAIGMAGIASAAPAAPSTGPGHSYAPAVKAHPAPESTPGGHAHRHRHGHRHHHFAPGDHR